MASIPSELFDQFASADGSARRVVGMLANKWKVLILIQLCGRGTVRFRAMQRLLTGVSQKMLTESLRSLEHDGFVRRTAYPVVPPCVEYAATERAMALVPLLRELCRWSAHYMEAA